VTPANAASAVRSPAPSRARAVLFDIDGTLLRCGGQAGVAFLEALAEVFGRDGARAAELRGGYSFAGRTDPRIAIDLMARAGVDESLVRERLGEVRERYLDRLGTRLDPRRVEILPGVRELLDRLSERSDLQLGLLTGNWRGGALLKLRALGLERYFPFGAFGDDGIDRDELPPFALHRARERVERELAAGEALVVGDTPADVRCARCHGIPVLAVASGRSGVEELRAAGADWVVSSLAETLAVCGALA
jgi:phosphoglycolate phosphatase-like HAD superfamily hydrolase